MRRKSKISGMYQRPNGIWQVDKLINGQPLRFSCGTRDEREAEAIAHRRIAEFAASVRDGIRPRRTFEDAAIKYLEENAHKRALWRDALALGVLAPYINRLDISQVHSGTLARYIADRQRSGISNGTIARDLVPVRRILTLCARLWRHDNGRPWIDTAPLIQLPKDTARRRPYPISWAEQRLLLPELPPHLAEMSLFALHTGCRQGEICALRWDWEARIPELSTSVFILPEAWTKTGRERVVVLNRVAASVVDARRKAHPEFVFSYKGHGVQRLNNSAWRSARIRAGERYKTELGKDAPDGFKRLRVHDLRHTLGRRMRALGLPIEDREDILGHHGGRMTTHYAAAEIGRLIEGLNRVADMEKTGAKEITLLQAAGR